MELMSIMSSAILGGLMASGVLKLVLDKSLSASLSKILKENEIGGKAELSYRERQLEELYGPIYSYLESNKVIYPLWLDGKLKEVNYEIIKTFKAQNDRINEIITNKAHLIDGDVMPEEFTAFITSSQIWNLYCIRENEPYLPEHVANLPEAAWPQRFEIHINKKTIDLKKRLSELYEKYKIN